MTEEPPEWAKEIGRKMPGVAELDEEIKSLTKELAEKQAEIDETLYLKGKQLSEARAREEGAKE